ncbi:FAD-binding oxidoreductase [Alsobacter sp. R-9]
MSIDSAPAARRPSAEDVAAVTAALAARFGNRVVTSQAVREQHANSVTWIRPQAPDAVVYPETTEEVAEIVRLCASRRMPVIPFGAGTSLEGHTNAPFGGVCIDLAQMNAVLAVHPEDLDCVVQPGITRKRLNEHLRDMGLFFPIDPGADATLGGMASTRASGTNAVRYGTMKDNVLALTVVTAAGEVMRTTRRARKSSAGYDLTRLFVGAEGTLGVITEMTLRLHGIPEAISAAVCPFPSVRAACDAAILAIQTGLPVARVELVDETQVRAINAYSKLSLAERPMLFLEFHGTTEGVKEQAERFGDIARDLGGGPFEWTDRAEDRTRLWQARHDAYWAAMALRPGLAALSTDVCVPLSRLADCVEETQQDIAETGLIAPILGHVGDGNFHVLVSLDAQDRDEVARVEAFLERLVDRALSMDGTCTGEHGVGQKKMKYLEREHDPAALGAMRAIKAALDPLGIMNPGKVVA